MVWALLAKFLLKQPPLVQAIVLGLCTGLFITAMAEANERDPVLRSVAGLVLGWAAVSGALYYSGFVYQHRRQPDIGPDGPRWLFMMYAVVWVFGLAAALAALFGEGGFKVAVLAIVPLVLLAPTALHGIRMTRQRVDA